MSLIKIVKSLLPGEEPHVTRLRYLFIAHYKNGEKYYQTKDDTSVIDPSRSAFFDVDHSQLERFELRSWTDSWMVDLRDGAFIHNGDMFMPMHGIVKDFEVVYYRRHQQTVSQTPGSAGHTHWYVLGVKGKLDNGQPHECTIEFA